jgi:hypothetical protein
MNSGERTTPWEVYGKQKEGSELSCLEQAAIWAKTAKNKVRSKGHFFYPWKDKDRHRFE